MTYGKTFISFAHSAIASLFSPISLLPIFFSLEVQKGRKLEEVDHFKSVCLCVHKMLILIQREQYSTSSCSIFLLHQPNYE